MRQTQITAIKRLIEATSSFGNSTHVVEQQVTRIQGRLRRGVDVDGNSFAPYKDPRAAHANSRPLERAARLFESPAYDFARTLEGAEFKATITGQAAKIAVYQNVRRRFLGYSDADKKEVRTELMSMIAEMVNGAK